MRFIAPLVLIGLGVLFWLDNLGFNTLNFGRDWPVILIIIGGLMLAGGVVRLIRRKARRARRDRKGGRVSVVIDRLEKGEIDPQEAEELIKGG